MASDELADVPLLQTARVVTRYCLPEGNSELPHVTRLLSAYLGTFSAYWTILTAYKRTKSLLCVQFVAARESAETQDPFYKRWLLNRSAELAARDGDLPTLQWLMGSYLPAEYLDNVVGHVLRAAAEAGNLDVVRWLCEEYNFDGADVLSYAIWRSQEETARWIIDRYDVSGIDVDMGDPAIQGRLPFLKYLASRNFKSTYGLSPAALLFTSSNGHLDVVKWLHHEHGQKLHIHAIREAARSGHLDVVKWMFETSVESSPLERAVEAGRVAVLKWLRRCRCTLGTVTMDWVVWLFKTSGGLCEPSVLVSAAGAGQLAVLEWLEPRSSVDLGTAATNWAAREGHLEVVVWLHVNRKEGCTQFALNGAAGAGHLEVVKWLHEHRTEGCSTAAMNRAACNGHLDVVKWLHHNRSEGCTKLAMNLAARNGHFSVVKWLHENRSEGCTSAAMDTAAKYGHLKIVKWLHTHYRFACSTNAMEKAAASAWTY